MIEARDAMQEAPFHRMLVLPIAPAPVEEFRGLYHTLVREPGRMPNMIGVVCQDPEGQTVDILEKFARVFCNACPALPGREEQLGLASLQVAPLLVGEELRVGLVCNPYEGRTRLCEDAADFSISRFL